MNKLLVSCLLFSQLTFSNSVSGQSQAIARQIIHYSDLCASSQDILKRIDQKILSLQNQNNDLEPVFEQGSLYLLSEQNQIEFPVDGSTLKFPLLQYRRNLDHLDRLSVSRTKYEKKYEQANQRLMRLRQKQDQLFADHPQLSGMRAAGKENRESVLKGTLDLPAFGGMKNRSEEETGCMAYIDVSSIEPSAFFLRPFESGSVSAGTWTYPQGGTHLGMDYAVDLYSPLLAPANGIIVYADAPAEDNGGFLGNWEGWPAGGGNTIGMLTKVEDTYYFLTFAHLSKSLHVRAGQIVSQGDVLALSGNSGNSSGPHCHIEVFKISTDVDSVLRYVMETVDFSLANGWEQPAACSQYACRIRPESVLEP